MYNRPGDSGLLARLDAMQHQIDELTRRKSRSPTCIVYLGADVEVWGGDAVDVVVNTSWQTEPIVDTENMWNPGTDSYVRLPYAGRYRLLVHSRWRRALNYNPQFPNTLASSILVNGATPATAIAEETTFHMPEANPSLTLFSEERGFEAGDLLRFNFWSRYAGPRMLASSLQDHTYFAITYLGSY